MDYNKKAFQWYGRALTEEDSFVKFILFYIALDVHLKNEGRTVRSLKTDANLLKCIDIKFISDLRGKLDVDPHVNMVPRGHIEWGGKLQSNTDLDGLIEFLIRARNNLFHGDKGPEEERDIFIVENGNKLIEPILKKLLTDN